MELFGFIRLALPYILETAVTLTILWIIAKMLKKARPENIKTINLAWMGLSSLAVIIFAISIAISVGINLIPRSDIDRRGLDQQNQQWEQNHIK